MPIDVVDDGAQDQCLHEIRDTPLHDEQTGKRLHGIHDDLRAAGHHSDAGRVFQRAAEAAFLGHAGCKDQRERGRDEKLPQQHERHLREHLGFGSPEFFGLAIRRRQPHAVDEKIRHPDGDERDEDREEQTLDVHVGGSAEAGAMVSAERLFRQTSEVSEDFGSLWLPWDRHPACRQTVENDRLEAYPTGSPTARRPPGTARWSLPGG